MKDWFWLLIVSFTLFLLCALVSSIDPEYIPVIDINPELVIDSEF